MQLYFWLCRLELDVEVSDWPDRRVQEIFHTGLALPHEQVNRNIEHTTI